MNFCKQPILYTDTHLQIPETTSVLHQYSKSLSAVTQQGK